MPIEGDRLYLTREEVIANLLARWQELVPDVWLGEDGNVRLFTEVYAGVAESVYHALEIFGEDMYIITANVQALQQYGLQYGNAQKVGVKADGTLKFDGAGGTYIPIGTEVSYEVGGGLEPLYFITTVDGSIPSPGVPTPPTMVDAGVVGVPNGVYRYVTTFLTAAGETLPSVPSLSISVVSKKINVANIAIGGVGTIGRRLYREIGADGVFKLLTTINNNTATTYQDNLAQGALVTDPPLDSTAESISLDAQAEEFGVQYNVAASTITELVDAPDGVVAVSNPAPFTGGTDPEDIEDFRDRLITTIRGPGSGSTTDLKRWAEEVPGVDVATVFTNDNVGTPANGHTTVRISGQDGAVPDASVVTAVATVLADKDLANITIHVTTFTAVTTHVTATTTLEPDFVLTDIQPSVVDAISSYITNLGVGETLYITGIIAAVVELPGVVDVAVSVPGSNQTTPASSKRTPGTITVS